MKKFMAAWFADWQKKLKDHAVIIGLFIGILTLLTGGIGIWLSRIPPEIPPKIIAPILSPEAPGEPPLPTHIRKTPFFGRKEEIKTLFQFASGDKRKFSWWLVCGAGGTGKTRLAAEFASRLAKKSWNAGFIDLGRMPRVTWDTWKPDKPAFIIVDNASLYVAMDPPRPLDDSARPADLVRMMTMLSERADSFDYPVRLLLLERTWKQQEAKEDDAARQREISTAWFERLQKQNASCYQPDRPLELGPLEDEGLMNIARNKLGEKTPQDFIRQLSKIDPLKRTLFAEYLALYLQEHGPPMQRVLKQEDLLHFMGQREAKTTWRHATVERQEFLSIILATLTGKACQVGPEHYSDKADPKQYCFDRQKTLANHGIGFFDEHVFYLGPLKPDILGEFCVLSGGMGSQNPAWYLPTGSRLEADNPLKDLVLKAWAINPEGTFSFFFRCVSDFKENSNLPHLLSYIPEGAAQQLFWARAALHMGNAQNDRARYDDALGWYKKSLAIREKHLGPDHPDTGTSYNNIGSVYESQGEYEKALEWYGKSLAIREKHLGPDHPDTGTSYNNIGLVYKRQGDYAKALEWYGKYRAICEKVHGPDHPDTGTSYNNIAGVYGSQGAYDKALEWYKKSLAIHEKHLGPDHPDTGTSYNNIGSVYERQGDYAKALEWHKKSLAIREKHLGPDHPDTGTSYNNIGSVYERQGDYAKALEWHKKSLAILEKHLGPDHPATGISYNNIAGVYESQGEYEKALEWYGKYRSICEKVHGPDHPDTGTSYNNIGLVYKRQGDYAKALEWYGKSLTIREKHLGPDHPATGTSYNNIAGVYESQGEYEKALEWYKKSLAILEKHLGPDHPDTGTSYNNIGSVYERQGDYAKALEWYGKSLAIKLKHLGPDHPSTGTSYNNIGLVYEHQGEYEKALEEFLRAYHIFSTQLRKNHPHTQLVYKNMADAYAKSGNQADFSVWLEQALGEKTGSPE